MPIVREHSVDEDLLEDSKFGIERHFRERGYCNPRVDYRRDAHAALEGQPAKQNVLRVTLTVAHGPQCVVENTEIVSNAAIATPELTLLVVTRAGQPFSESTLASDAVRIQGYYRQRGFAGVKVTTQVERR